MALYNHQIGYNFFPRLGAPGRIVDLAPYAVDAFINGEETGVMELGLGVVKNEKGNIIKPLETSTAANFVGIVVNGGTIEHGIEGENFLRATKNLGVMRYGRIYAQVVSESASIIDKPAHLIIKGADAGKFTDTSSSNTVAVKARFLSEKDGSNSVAVVELFNQAQA